MKSEWAGSKIPGLKVSNPRGLSCNKEGGEEEGQDILSAQSIYREAVRRGSKRMKYVGGPHMDQETNEEEVPLMEEDRDPLAPAENPEDRVWPWVKRRRVSGRIGEGWDKISPEKKAGLKVRGRAPEGQKK